MSKEPRRRRWENELRERGVPGWMEQETIQTLEVLIIPRELQQGKVGPSALGMAATTCGPWKTKANSE